jgi:ubiquinone/menaquinone biosynthesis C-methylase UbiE
MKEMSLDTAELRTCWDEAAKRLEIDRMRSVRYGKCFRYLVNVPRDMKILEVGCGEGTGLTLLRSLGFHSLTGIEISAERLKQAKSRLRDNASLVLISPTEGLPFKNGAFNAVISAAVIEHAINPRAFVEEVARVVRTDGYVIISSDCYQWRVLQLLGSYHSVQPIDRALFPITICRYFRESHLQLLHYEGFPLPGQEFRFLRMLISALVRYPQKVIRKLVPRALKLRASPPVRDRKTDTQDRLPNTMLSNGGPMFERWSRKLGMTSFLRLIFSDENVFFVVKR